MRYSFLAAVSLCAELAAAAPQVSNVTASQRADDSGLVDITYDLAGGVEPMTAFVLVSTDGGATWKVHPEPGLTSGDTGPGATNGTGKHVVWDAGTQRPGITWTDVRARVIVTETIDQGSEDTILLPGDVPLTLVAVPAGTVTMGVEEKGWANRRSIPVHSASIPHNFAMGKFEVTRGQWNALLPSTPWIQEEYPDDYFPGPDTAAHRIGFNDAQEWLAALNAHVEASGQGPGNFRLPTEAEWEYAARGGSQDTFWFDYTGCSPSGGDYSTDDCQLPAYAWFVDNTAYSWPRPIGQLLPNPFGFHDILGNVSEWCLDMWAEDYWEAPVDGSPHVLPPDDENISSRVVRGGSGGRRPSDIHPAARFGSSVAYPYEEGLRVFRPLGEEETTGRGSGSALSQPFSVDTTANIDPPNELLATAQELIGWEGSLVGSTVGALREPLERDHGGYLGGSSVWYRFTTSDKGTLYLSTCGGSQFDTVLGVYHGTGFDNFWGSSRDSTYYNSDCEVVPPQLYSIYAAMQTEVRAGETIHIAVDGANAESGIFTLDWKFVPAPPANDWFPGPLLTGQSGGVQGRTDKATRQAGEPAHAGEADSPTVWYSWNAPGPGPATLDTCEESDFESVLAVYTGNSVTNLRRVTVEEEECPDLGSRVTFMAATETTYRIAVAGRGTQKGTFRLNWSGPEPPASPANDDFANALAISGTRGATSGATISATRESQEPSHAGQSQSGSVWYRWTPPQEGNAVISTLDSASFDTVIGVYTGTGLGSLSRVAEDDDSGPFGRSAVSLRALPESTYHVAVAGKGVASGFFQLSWSLDPFDPMDDPREPNNTWIQGRLHEPLLVGDRLEEQSLYNEDWYRIAIGPEESVLARLEFDHSLGDINAELYDLRIFGRDGWPTRVGESYSPLHPWIWNPAAGDGPEPLWENRTWGPATPDDEWITFVNNTGATEVFLRVYGEQGATNPAYSVAIDSLGVDDQFEPNNHLEQAATIATGAPYEWLTGRDNDFYRIDTAGIDALRVRLSCYALLGTMYFEVHGIRQDGSFGPIEESKMYEPNRYEAERTVCVQGQDEIFLRVYPAVRKGNLYNMFVEPLDECP
ncbi:MAG: hypothetical protein PWP23_2826 [Candidatus Sumerlaeota bacterium]|nr:hypothetical protein [Candidatus Sumerlaeota bacterium]